MAKKNNRLTKEIWKTLDAPFDTYEASNLGDVRRLKTARDHGDNPPLKKVPARDKYKRGFTVQLSNGMQSKHVLLHRLIGSLFNGFPKRGIVYWKDGDMSNNSSSNLLHAASHDEIPALRSTGKRPRNKRGEKWLPVVGYEGLYEVSNLGRVLRVCPSVRGPSGRLVGNKPGRGGYVTVTLSKLKKQKTIGVHQLVAEAFIPRPSKDASVVDHINEPKSDNRVDNLRWVTHGQNMEHAFHEAAERKIAGKPPKTKNYEMPPVSENAIWCPVLEWGVDGAYEVSNLGHVRRVKPARGCRVGRILKVRELPSGYLVVKMRVPGKKNGVIKAVHQVVASAFELVKQPHHEVIHHINHNKKDNRPENLEWVTKKENAQAAVEAGQFERDGKHVSAIVSRADAKRIRQLAHSKTRKQLSAKFQISEKGIDSILKNETYYDPDYTPIKAASGLIRGVGSHKTSLTESEVLAVVRYSEQRMSYEQIKEILDVNISLSTIGNIVNGHTWSHLTGIKKTQRQGLIDTWDRGYQACLAWCEIHQTLGNVKVEDSINEFEIGSWIDHRRTDKKEDKLSSTQIRLLDEMGMVWDPQGSLMDQRMAAVRQYARDHGSLKGIRIEDVVSYPSLGVEKFKIGKWIGMQRTRRNQLLGEDKKPSKRLQQCFDELTRLGIDWSPKRGPKKAA